MYPTPRLAQALKTNPSLLHDIWEALNRITPERLLAEGRVYGGGMHKLEPRELANVPVPEIAALLASSGHDGSDSNAQRDLFANVRTGRKRTAKVGSARLS